MTVEPCTFHSDYPRACPICAIERENEALRSTVGQLETRNTSLAERTMELEGRAKELERQVSELKFQTSELNSQIIGLNAQLSGLKDELYWRIEALDSRTCP